MLSSMPITRSPNGTTESQLRPILDIVERIQEVQRDEDVDGFVELFHPDAVWVTGGGQRLIGRDQIAEFTRKVLPGATAHSTATYELVHVAFVRDDVALASVRQRYTPVGADALDHHEEGRPTYLMATDDRGVWKLVAGQNTAVAP
ncbi:hypothetical protein BH10ACT3_BH10ACT3_03280 [soil metagenome]